MKMNYLKKLLIENLIIIQRDLKILEENYLKLDMVIKIMIFNNNLTNIIEM